MSKLGQLQPNTEISDLSDIPIISVSYNAPRLIDTLISSIRQFYSNKIFIIDGSEASQFNEIKDICEQQEGVELIHFDYNIHHGPGMAWAFQNLPLVGRVLVLDSDVIVVNPGFLESLAEHLKPGMYGVGYLGIVNEEGFDLDPSTNTGIPYLKPACMLCNIEEVLKWPMPAKHGAPLTPTMIAIHNANRPDLLGRVDWLHKDFHSIPPTQYLIHDWQGTVKTINSYELDDWLNKARERKTIVELIASLIPQNSSRIVEIGENDGLLARTTKDLLKDIAYTSVQNISANTIHKKIFSDKSKLVNFDQLLETDFLEFENTDCWIIDQGLEVSRWPAKIIEKIREVWVPQSTLIIHIPNPQNWQRMRTLITGGPVQYTVGTPKFERLLTVSDLTILLSELGFTISNAMQLYLGQPAPENVISQLFEFSGHEQEKYADYKKLISAESFLIVAN